MSYEPPDTPPGNQPPAHETWPAGGPAPTPTPPGGGQGGYSPYDPPATGQPPYGEQPPYGQQPPGQPPFADPGYYGYAQPPTNSILATLSLVFGIIGIISCGCCYGVFGIAGLVLGILGINEVKNSNGAKTGHGIAMAGAITGGIAIVLAVLWIVFSVVLSIAEPSFLENY